MKKLLGQQVGHRDIEEIIRDVDLNGDGRVDFEGEKESVLPVPLLWCESEFHLRDRSRREDLHAEGPGFSSMGGKKKSNDFFFPSQLSKMESIGPHCNSSGEVFICV